MYRFLFCLVLALAFVPQFLNAQSRSIVGHVLDAESGEPLEGAFVAAVESGKGTYTDVEGLFVLELETAEPIEVVAKYLGYKTEILIVNPRKVNQLKIELVQDGITLKPTLITDQALRQVHPDKTLYIKDYTFLNDHYLMVVVDQELRRNKLVLLDEELNTVEEHFGLGEEPVSLFTDCMGVKHYLTKNQACQVDLVKGELVIQKSSRADFDTVVLPCRANSGEIYYFEDRLSKYATGYYFVEKYKGAKMGFYYTMDSASVQTVKDEANMAGSPLSDLPGNGSRAQFQQQLNASYLKTIQCPESYTPLFFVDDAVTIFDHNNDKIVRFNEFGTIAAAASLSYDKERFWERKILVDEEQKRAFTVFNKLGRMTVAQISLDDGSILDRWELPKNFISRIQVRGNEIFFLYKDNIYDPVNRLYAFNMSYN